MPKKFLNFVVLGLLSIVLILLAHQLAHRLAPRILSKVTPPLSSEINLCPLVDTNFPAATLVNNNQRGEIYLNGVWQFLPELGTQKTPPPATADWGEILVPGDWQKQTYFYTAGVEKLGQGKVWEDYQQDYQGENFSLAWYQHRVTIPPEWQGRSILLDLTRISTEAVVYVNDGRCGAIPWAGGAIDISQVVTPGQSIDLKILVAAVPTEEDQQVIFGPNQVVKASAKLDAKGLVGDVRLLSLPNNGRINDVFIQTSTRQKQIKLDIELTEFLPTDNLQIIAKILDESGNLEKEFTKNIPITAKTANTINIPNSLQSSQSSQSLQPFLHKVSVNWEWLNPRLWEVGKGNLYTLKLTVQGAGIRDEYDQTFGFREFWIEERKFYLNGRELRLRPVLHEDQWRGWAMGVPAVLETLLTSYAEAGFNIAQIWPWNHDIRGRWHFQNLVASIADRQGLPLIFPALDMTNYTDRRVWDSKKSLWEQRMARELRGDRNHPSILLWGTSPNYFGHGDDQNPLRIGKKQVMGEVPKNWRGQTWQEAAAIGESAVSIIKNHDPTRPVLVHQGAAVGDVYALNSYLNLLPLQEREDWLSQWSQTGDQPYMVVEFGTPLHLTMMRSRNGFLDAIHSEPLMTEFTAIYLGKEAYQLETKNYRDRIKSQFIKNREYKNWQGNADLDFSPAFQKLLALFNTNTWRSWRTYGITGGMLPWNDGHGWEVTDVGEEVEEKEKEVQGGTGRYREVQGDGVIEGDLGIGEEGWTTQRYREAQKEELQELQELQQDKQQNGGRDIREIQEYSGQRGVFMPRLARRFREPWQSPSYQVQPSGRAIEANNGATLAWIAGASPNFTSKDHSFWAGERLQKQVVLINDTRERQDFNFRWQVVVDDLVIGNGEAQGSIAPAQTLFFPLKTQLPPVLTKQSGEIQLQAQIGTVSHTDRFPLRVFPGLDNPARQEPRQFINLQVFDRAGKTTAMLQKLGYEINSLNSLNSLNSANSLNSTNPNNSTNPHIPKPIDSPELLIIGREALEVDGTLPESLRSYIENGGRAIVFIQQPAWYKHQGLRISPHLSRRVFSVDPSHPVAQGLDEMDLRDWRGSSTLTEAYPDTIQNPPQLSPHNAPWYGWHWGNGGAVSSVPLEKPHYSGWRSILQSEFDLAYTPLMELDYGQGKLILTTLDLEDHYLQDPATAQLARQLITYAANPDSQPNSQPNSQSNLQPQEAVFIGNEGDTVLLDNLGLRYQRAEQLIPEAGLHILSATANLADRDLQNYLKTGGKLFLLPPATPDPNQPNSRNYVGKLGIKAKWQANFPGSLQVPSWAATRGLGIADLHARTDFSAWVITEGGELGGNGLFAKVQFDQGKGQKEKGKSQGKDQGKGQKEKGKGQELGVAIATTLNPQSLLDPEAPPETLPTYLRLTRWRQTRAIGQVLANLGATFRSDDLIWQQPPNFWEKSWADLQEKFLGKPPQAGFYHLDYWEDFNYGDDPYRYYRW